VPRTQGGLPISFSRTVHFCFANPVVFSGQKAATILVYEGLSERGWDCHLLPQPVLARDVPSAPKRLASYWFQLVRSWLNAFRLLWSPRSILHVSLGQTVASFVRDGVPFVFALLRRHRIYIALNGGLFMRWAEGSFEARVFSLICRRATGVIVLGNRQRARLVELGVEDCRIHVIPNTCPPPTQSAAKLPTDEDQSPEEVVHVLYLSSLIASKGYPELLEALLRMGQEGKERIEATVCGQVVPSEFDGRFRSAREATEWIESMIEAINQTDLVTIRWVRGAVGEVKANLYRDADIFILPTQYPVEAQPLVLLEAMASRCAIITSRAGEIETILDEESAVLLERVSVDEIKLALVALAGDGPRRERLGTNALGRYALHFAPGRHIDLWEACLRRPDRADEI
jgi:glycosyltransferase involved in cell wall biosynthesis